MRWKILVLSILVGGPVLALLGISGWLLWREGWLLAVWLGLAASWGIAAVLLALWRRRWRTELLLAPDPLQISREWTDRDRAAWSLVEARLSATAELDAQALVDPDTYIRIANELASELARHYYPGTSDPLGPLTVPEILAVAELVAGDLSDLVDKSVPGSHVVSIDTLRQAPRVMDWYKLGVKLYRIGYFLIDPVRATASYAASTYGTGAAMETLKENLLAGLYAAYVGRMGRYLIEVYSGRLRIGARRWRELMRGGKLLEPRSTDAGDRAASSEASGDSGELPRQTASTPPTTGPQPTTTGPQPATPPHQRPTHEEPPAQDRELTLVVVGQVKAGKSSLINALLGGRAGSRGGANVDVLPTTRGVSRYRFQPPGWTEPVAVLDTPGYAEGGPVGDGLDETLRAVEAADMVLLVLHAGQAAREPDQQFLDRLGAWQRSRPERKRPPMLAVVTHIDELRPVREWAPPYLGWTNSASPKAKEQSIRKVVDYVRDWLGPAADAVVPACTGGTEPGFGVSEFLLPAAVNLLSEASAKKLLDAVNREVADRSGSRTVWEQVVSAGRELLRSGYVRGKRDD